MNADILGACDHVVAAAVNGVYQGVIIALLVGLGLCLLGRTNAATRHAIWFATMLLLAALIPAHWLRDYFLGTDGGALAHKGDSETVIPVPNSDYERTRVASQSSSSSESTSPIREERGYRQRPEGPALASYEVAPRNAKPTTQLNLPGADRPADAYANHGATLSASQSTIGEKSRRPLGRFFKPTSWSFAPGTIPRLTSLVLLAAWLAGAGMKLSLLLWRLLQIRKLKARAVAAEDDLEARFQRLRRQLSVNRNVQLRVSPSHRSPVLLGFVHPVVLLPAAQVADNAETETILRHELAHVRRWDDWANLAQHVIQTVLFFHPVVWWISRQLSVHREIACDDFVLEQSGRPRAYALLLADLASRIKTQRPLLAPGVTTSKSQLQKRIDMILDTRRNTSPRLAKSRLGFITSAAALLAALAIYSAPRLVLAQAPTAPPAAENAPAVNALPASSVAPAALPRPPGPTDVAAAVEGEADAPTSEVPPAIEPGPKNKSRDSSDRVPKAAGGTRPATPTPSAVVVVRPDSVQAPYVVAVPRPSRSPDLPNGDSSIEKRLRRLEKLVESLLAQKDQKHASNGFLYKDVPHEYVWTYDDKIKQLGDMAEREAARAAEQAKRAAKEADKAMKLQQNRETGKVKENFAKQIEALHKQREALERQMEKLQQEIERLEQEQERLQEEQQHQSDLLEDESMDADNMALLQEPCLELLGAPAALAK